MSVSRTKARSFEKRHSFFVICKTDQLIGIMFQLQVGCHHHDDPMQEWHGHGHDLDLERQYTTSNQENEYKNGK